MLEEEGRQRQEVPNVHARLCLLLIWNGSHAHKQATRTISKLAPGGVGLLRELSSDLGDSTATLI